MTFTKKRNFVADFLQVKCNFTRKTAVLRFRLIGKLVVDFLLVLIELLLLGVTADVLRANID